MSEELEKKGLDTGRKIATINHLANPVMYNDDGTSRVLKLHQYKGLKPERVEDLMKGAFEFAKVLEIEGHFYFVAYGYGFSSEQNTSKANLPATIIANHPIMGPAILLSEAHFDPAEWAAYCDRRKEEEKQKLWDAYDDAVTRGVIDPEKTPRPTFEELDEEVEDEDTDNI